jgi:guanylate kinase
VISGPSGAGKTTIVEEILKKDSGLSGSVSATTRPPRADEVEGEAYFFVTDDEFARLKQGKLVEWAEVHGHFYGTPREFVDTQLAAGRDVVLNIDVQGGKNVKKAFPQTVLIFILTPSQEELEARINKRASDLSEDITTRLDNAWGEIQMATRYDYVVVNDDLEDTVSTVLAIIRSERHRRGRYPDGFLERYNPDK